MAAPLMDELAALVRCESPSDDPAATAECARVAGQIGTAKLGKPPEELDSGGRTHLRWRFGRRCRVLLLGHLDTVWQRGPWPGGRSTCRATG